MITTRNIVGSSVGLCTVAFVVGYIAHGHLLFFLVLTAIGIAVSFGLLGRFGRSRA